MVKALGQFEKIVRMSGKLAVGQIVTDDETHPFDQRNVHPDISKVSKRLFDDGHFSQATFEAFKLVDNRVKKIAKSRDSGQKLMMAAFSEKDPKIKLTNLSSVSEEDEQAGFKFIFAGAMGAIRNPRGHENKIDPIERSLDHLSLASVLLRRLEERVSP